MHTARLPPDLLWLEWFQGRRPETWDAVRGHPLYVYHRNLLDHIGALSSFAVRPERLPFPRCFDSMATVWSIHTKERFNVRPSPARRCRTCSVHCQLRHSMLWALNVASAQSPVFCINIASASHRSISSMLNSLHAFMWQAAAVTTSCV